MNSRATRIALLLVALWVLGIDSVNAGEYTSVRTALNGSPCSHRNAIHLCPGVAGMRLEVVEDDARTTVNVLDASGKKHGLEYWDVVTRAFSSVGPFAEWRVERQGRRLVPKGLIVRVDSTEMDTEDQPKRRSYLAVAKITPAEICVTDKMTDTPENRRKARLSADSAAEKSCLKPLE